MALTSEQEIVTDNAICLTHPSHLKKLLNCPKTGSAQSSGSRVVAKVLNFLNKQSSVTDATLSTRKWGLHEIFKFLYRLMLMTN